MALLSGKMYRPTDIASHAFTNSVYVVEQFNHRVSKWIYEPNFFDFSLANGNVTSLTLANGGTSGYTTALLVIDGPTGTAAATPTVSTGAITSIAVSNGGSGYTTPPAVTIVAVTGSGATATANISNGIVVSITVTNQGSSYVDAATVTPIVVIDAPEGKSRATATAVANGTSITSVTLVSNGNGYTVASPAVAIAADSPNSGNASVTSTANTTPWGSNGDGTSGIGGPIGNGGPTDNALDNPTGIAFDSTNSRLYVTDTHHNRVRVINSATGAFVSSFGTGGFGTANFYHPAGIAINFSTGTTLVIADEFNHRAVKYDVNGGAPNNPVVLPDPSASAELSFIRPHGVFFDENALDFGITDSLRGRITLYDTSGVFQTQFGVPGSTANNVNLFYPGSGEGTIFSNDTAFADTRNNAIKGTEAGLVQLFTGTSAGVGNGQLYWLESVAAFSDTADYVLAANTYNNRVEIFSISGTVLSPEAPFNFGKP